MEITIEYQPILEAPAAIERDQAPAASGVKSIKNKQIMQNKPNFRKTKMNVTSFYTVDYENKRLADVAKTKPIQTQYKPNTKPIQTQFPKCPK